MGHERRRGVKDDTRFLPCATGKMELVFTEMSRTGKRIDLEVLVSKDDWLWFWKLLSSRFLLDDALSYGVI